MLNNPARVQDPVPGVITRLHGNYTYHLHVTIPQDLRVVAGVPIKLTLLHIVAGRGKWLELTSAPQGVKVRDHVRQRRQDLRSGLAAEHVAGADDSLAGSERMWCTVARSSKAWMSRL